MKEEKCRVIENHNLAKDYFLMKLETSHIAEQAKPGNFVMIAVSSSLHPLLKRPFGIFKAEAPLIWIYYNVVGLGTKIMSQLKSGDQINVLGPLGNSFPELKKENILLIAGGRGIAPIFFATTSYMNNNKLFLIFGGKSATDLNLINEINSLDLQEVYLYTEDGSKGHKGLATFAVKDKIKTHGITTTLSCGPDGLFKSLARELKNSNTKNYVSVEALMGCGFGICHSCVIRTQNNYYKNVCSDGPVFSLEEIKW